MDTEECLEEVDENQDEINLERIDKNGYEDKSSILRLNILEFVQEIIVNRQRKMARVYGGISRR